MRKILPSGESFEVHNASGLIFPVLARIVPVLFLLLTRANAAYRHSTATISKHQPLIIMNTQQAIEQKLHDALSPQHLEVTNESHMHNVPEGSESHFKVVVVSDGFSGKNLLARHRQINRILAEELQGGVHALALHTMTTAEWFEKAGKAPDSPLCLGGGKQS